MTTRGRSSARRIRTRHLLFRPRASPTQARARARTRLLRIAAIDVLSFGADAVKFAHKSPSCCAEADELRLKWGKNELAEKHKSKLRILFEQVGYHGTPLRSTALLESARERSNTRF